MGLEVRILRRCCSASEKDGEAFGDGGFKPIGQPVRFLRPGTAISGNKVSKFCLCCLKGLGVPNLAQLFADAFSDRNVIPKRQIG